MGLNALFFYGQHDAAHVHDLGAGDVEGAQSQCATPRGQVDRPEGQGREINRKPRMLHLLWLKNMPARRAIIPMSRLQSVPANRHCDCRRALLLCRECALRQRQLRMLVA